MPPSPSPTPAFSAKRLRRLRPKALLAGLSVLATVFAIGTALAAFVLPSAHWAEAADMITPLMGHVLIGGVAAGLAVWLQRHEVVILSAGVVIAILGHSGWAIIHQPHALWPKQDTASSTTNTPPRHVLRVYELNTWDRNRDLPRLEQALMAVDADVLVLAEADPLKLAMLERLKARYPFQISCAQHYECAMALLSRLPIIAGGAARTNVDVPPLAWARIDAASLGLGPLTIVGTHVQRPTRGPWLHARQMRSLAALLVAIKGPLIVAGDFNSGFWSQSFRALLGTTHLLPFATLLPTWPATPLMLPQVALDHILVSHDLVVTRAGVGPATGSDHAPVFAEIGMQQGAN